jgi:hypothetical protein
MLRRLLLCINLALFAFNVHMFTRVSTDHVEILEIQSQAKKDLYHITKLTNLPCEPGDFLLRKGVLYTCE